MIIRIGSSFFAVERVIQRHIQCKWLLVSVACVFRTLIAGGVYAKVAGTARTLASCGTGTMLPSRIATTARCARQGASAKTTNFL